MQFNPVKIVERPAVKRLLPFSSGIVPLLLFICLCVSASGFAQTTNDSTQSLTLKQCVYYALKNQPALMQSELNVEVARATNAINLAGWLPQVAVTGNLTHYIQQPTGFVNTGTPPTPTPQQTGVINTAIPGIGVTQAIFSPELLYAAHAAPLYVEQAQQITDSTKIFLVSAVSKSFYNLLLTLEEINVLKEDTVRLTKNYLDAYHQYVGGIVDETDYEEAAITLNNSKAQLKQATENIIPGYADLKQLMGYPPEKQFNVSYDTAQMINDVAFDTTQQLKYDKRIEIQQLKTQKDIQLQLVNYYRFSFLPTLSAFYNYNYEYENNDFNHLFDNAYPNSFIGLSVSIPIFTGFARLDYLHRAKLQARIIDWGGVNLQSQIYSEYASALANYKSNLYNLNVLRDNVRMANRVYAVVGLQYKQGIVAYLNVITAESNLISSQIGYINALAQLLSSKIDLEKSLGVISY
ncbi:MAG TPA: TolC family protein [Ferruginibacter sp.]|nr:TolC family protein [Ferruginibacter sp.]